VDGTDYPQAADINNPQDAIEAIEAKLGIDGSAVTTSHDYKLSGVDDGDKASSLTGAETFTNKTLTSPVLNTGVSGTAVLDEDNMASDSATKLATQQSIKKYVDDNSIVDIVDDTSPQLGSALDANGNDIQFDDATGIDDDSGNEQIRFRGAASAVNQMDVTNAATNNSPSIKATGGDTNIHLALAGKGNGLVKTSVLRQDNTSNSYETNAVILTGWGFVQGDGAEKFTPTDTVTFGITYSSVPIILVTVAGTATSDPSVITDLSGSANGYFASHWAPSTTGFTVNAYRELAAIGSSTRVGYSWVAIGQLND